MPVTDVSHDLDQLTLTITAEFAAPVERIWQVYADPRQLEQVFGPPSHPATVVDHDLTPGGRMNYFMTGPDGVRFHGIWEIDGVDQPSGFTFTDSFSNEQFEATPDLPVSKNVYAFRATNTGTAAVFTSTYESADALQQVLDMGVVEGATSAINQIDDLVAADAA